MSFLFALYLAPSTVTDVVCARDSGRMCRLAHWMSRGVDEWGKPGAGKGEFRY